MSRRSTVKVVIRYTLSRRKTSARGKTKRQKTRTIKPSCRLHKPTKKTRLASIGERCRNRLPRDNNNNASKSRLRQASNKKRKCLLRTDGVLYRLPNFTSGYKMSPRPAETIAATFHQRTGRKGMSSEFRGFQCTSMALAAILIAKLLPLHNWRTADMDAILLYGDLLHEDLILRRTKRLSDPRIAIHEIPTGDENKYQVPIPKQYQDWYARDNKQRKGCFLTTSDEFYGLVHTPRLGITDQHTDLGYTPLEEAVEKIFRQDFDGIVITVGDVSGSILKDINGKVRYFDSHCNNKWGRLCLDGKAVLVTFDNIADFTRLIRKREPRLQYRYELIGLKIHPIPEE